MLVGAAFAAPIWANYMRDIYNGMKDSKFSDPPEDVYRGSVCKFTGLLPSENCTETVSELMLKGSGPVKTCDGNHYEMKSVLEIYMEKEGLTTK